MYYFMILNIWKGFFETEVLYAITVWFTFVKYIFNILCQYC